ncbi:MAG: carbohydrate ABC transporter permease [Fermentimonas sp.]|jgi:raffinose/stachyose/melibiose transport system permease protein
MKTKKKTDWRGNISAGIMLSPAVLMLIICSIYPFIWIFRYINYNYNGFTAVYTGSQNFKRMLSDKQFWQSVITTFEYAALKLVFIIPLSLLLAILVNMRLYFSTVFRSIYFMPTVIASSISSMIFGFIFATQNGILNSILQALNIIDTPIKWLASTDYVMSAILIVALWGGLGNYMLYFLTGINGIDTEVYEASKIDGANAVQNFFYVTLPMLSPVLKVVLLLAITTAFKDYEAIMVLTKGGPGNRSMVMFLYIYNMIFGAGSTSQPQIGYGALLSVIAAVIVGAITGIYLLAARKLDKVFE